MPHRKPVLLGSALILLLLPLLQTQTFLIFSNSYQCHDDGDGDGGDDDYNDDDDGEEDDKDDDDDDVEV